MKKLSIILFLFMLLSLNFTTLQTQAQTIDLFDWAFNVNGDIFRAPNIYSGPDPGQLPPFFDDSAFDWISGLGTITLDYKPGPAGVYGVIAFFDHEIDEALNTYFNEAGSITGTLEAGLSWEIDDPFFGNIIDNVYNPPLDNTNNAPGPDDVSMALGWDLILNARDTATIDFILTDTAPSSVPFYLTHSDLDSPEDIFFYSSFDITPIPEPGTILLFGMGLLGLVGLRRKRNKQIG